MRLKRDEFAKEGTHHLSTKLRQILANFTGPSMAGRFIIYHHEPWKTVQTYVLHILFNNWEKYMTGFNENVLNWKSLQTFYSRVYPVFSNAGVQHIIVQDHFLQIHSGFSQALSEWRLSGGTMINAAPTTGKQSTPFWKSASWCHMKACKRFSSYSNTKKITWQIHQICAEKMQSLEMHSSLILSTIDWNPHFDY